MTILKVEKLSYQYGAVEVLTDLSFELEPNVIAALVGRIGVGKSTLLRCIAGWTMPAGGDITIAGVDLRRNERQIRQQVVFVPDAPDFYDELTAWDHLQFIAQLHRIDSWQAKSLELLEKFQLVDHRKAFPFTFSRGMQYKLALCMALLINPPLLLLDEPLATLDAVAGYSLWQHLQAYRTDGRSVIFSSHILPEGGSPDLLLLLHNRQITRIDPSEVVNLTQLLTDA